MIRAYKHAAVHIQPGQRQIEVVERFLCLRVQESLAHIESEYVLDVRVLNTKRSCEAGVGAHITSIDHHILAALANLA